MKLFFDKEGLTTKAVTKKISAKHWNIFLFKVFENNIFAPENEQQVSDGRKAMSAKFLPTLLAQIVLMAIEISTKLAVRFDIAKR